MKICKWSKKGSCTVFDSDDGFAICGRFKDDSTVPKCFEKTEEAFIGIYENE